jgi:uncharacterized protein with PIN domain
VSKRLKRTDRKRCPDCGQPLGKVYVPPLDEVIANCQKEGATANELDAATWLKHLMSQMPELDVEVRHP